MPRNSTTRSSSVKRKRSTARELIDTGRDKRFVRRDALGQFSESDDVGRSLRQDRKRKSRTVVKSGQGDKGDRRATARHRSVKSRKSKG